MNLYEYQNKGAAFLAARTRALLADDMGLGKSAQAIRGCELAGFKKPFVICPASVRENWRREFDLFSTEKIVPRVASFDELVRGPSKFKNIDFDLLIVDESHYLKNPKTKRTRAVLGAGGLAHKASSVWLLSGTPAPNHAAELWPMFKAFGATDLDYNAFVNRYCNSYEFKPYVFQISGTRQHRIPELKAMLAPFMLRRKKEDVLSDLPPISFNDIAISRKANIHQKLTPEIKADFERLEEVFEEAYSGGEYDEETMLRLLEMQAGSVSSLRKYCGWAKVGACAELIKEELDSNAYKKIVIFGVHRDVIGTALDALKAFKPVSITGSTPAKDRQAIVDRFQNDDACRVFLGNIRAAGTGITLTASNQVFFIEQEWVPGENAQAAMRCHRIGQSLPVFVRFAGLAGSVDQKIAYALARKSRELSQIFG